MIDRVIIIIFLFFIFLKRKKKIFEAPHLGIYRWKKKPIQVFKKKEK